MMTLLLFLFLFVYRSYAISPCEQSTRGFFQQMKALDRSLQSFSLSLPIHDSSLSFFTTADEHQEYESTYQSIQGALSRFDDLHVHQVQNPGRCSLLICQHDPSSVCELTELGHWLLRNMIPMTRELANGIMAFQTKWAHLKQERIDRCRPDHLRVQQEEHQRKQRQRARWDQCLRFFF